MFRVKKQKNELFVVEQNKDNLKIKKLFNNNYKKIGFLVFSIILFTSNSVYASPLLGENKQESVSANSIKDFPFHIKGEAQKSVFSNTKLYSKNPVINEFLNAPYAANSIMPLPTAKDFKIKNVTVKQKVLANVISQKYGINSDKALNVVKTAYKVSSENDVDPLMVLSIAAVESKFDDKARNRSGAVGLMQAMPSAHPEKIKAIKRRGNSLYDIQENLNMGAKIYRECLERANGNPKQALQRYNGSVKDKKQSYANKVYLAMSPLKKAIQQDPVS